MIQNSDAKWPYQQLRCVGGDELQPCTNLSLRLASDKDGLELGFGRFLESVALLIGNGDVALVAAVSSMRSAERGR
jgi:hypothetical protein